MEKSNKTLIIILVVVAILLCCCCLAFGWVAWNYGDTFVNSLNDMGAVVSAIAA